MSSDPSPMVLNEHSRFIEKMYLQRERELAAVQRISEALAQRMKMRDLIERALRTTLDILNAENGSLLLADADRKELVFCQSIGDKPVPYGTAIPWTRGIAGSVFGSGKPEVLRDAQKDPRYLDEIDCMCGSATHDMITMPLKTWQGDPIGVVQVMNKKDGQLGEQDVGILTIACALSTLAIEQARLFEQKKDAEVAQERIEALAQSQAHLRGLATELNLALVLGKMKLSQARHSLDPTHTSMGLLDEVDQALTQSLTYAQTLVAELAPPE